MSTKCTTCQVETEQDIDSKTLTVYEVLQYNERKPLVIGFPAPEDHLAQGWKFKKLEDVTSNLCESCVKEASDEVLAKRPATLAKLVEAGKIEGGIVLLALFISFIGRFLDFPSFCQHRFGIAQNRR
jgi:hypothetical protein